MYLNLARKIFFRGDIMSKRYNRQILSDALYELGQKLGRAPDPKDLTPDMARKKTYLSHFSSWEEALEYAGLTREPLRESSAEEVFREKEVVGTSIQQSARIKLINLCGRPIVFLGPNGESEAIPSSGYAKLVLEMKWPSAAKILAAETEYVKIVSERLKGIFVSTDDSERKIPLPADGTYYIVSEAVARNVYRFGRSSIDLLYPKKSYRSNDILYIEALGMVYTNNLPIEA